MEVVAISGQLRTDLGKKATKAVRNGGMIPCVLYGGDEIIHFSTNLKGVRDLIYTPNFKVAEVAIDGQVYKCFIKDIQWHPVTDEIVHLDFLRLIEGVPVKVEVPLRFNGVSPGVKNGGKLIQKLRRVKIRTTPEHLIGELNVDISKLLLNQSIRVRDIERGRDNIDVLNSPGVPVASVEVPRALRSATAAAEKAGEGEEEEEGASEEGAGEE
ncbi:MAG: 50S ribosomal protein L25 [Lewinellaceae bacterium]|nr:50S ribosomal protein L25 [Phaeodactylibacter sp.]MCB0616093.1 50S ribosomal protein L25 [Phaeodactylibacter sp.]MCB9348187.1 50S ribosomal protein L25 [Lewinellaceae bacterium]